MKKHIAILVIFMLLTFMIPKPCAADGAPDLSRASAALLYNTDTGSVIIEKNASEKVEVAGLKRLPALLTVCRAFDKGLISGDTVVTVTSEAASIKGATAFLAPNENISAELLLKAAVMLTAGDAVCSLLRSLYPSEATALMEVNKTLSEINAGKLESDSMGSSDKLSLYDLSRICSALKDSEAFLKYSSVYHDSLEHEKASATELTNPNRLVRFYSGCFGLATGSVGAGQYAGAFIARRGTTTFLAITAGMPDSASRFKLASDMLDYGFSSFRTVTIGSVGDMVGSISVVGGTDKTVDAVTSGTVTALMPVSDTKLVTETLLPDLITAPIKEGDAVGTLILKNSNDEKVGEVTLVAKRSVDKASFKDYFMRILTVWLNIKEDPSD